MKRFENVELEVLSFAMEDVVRTSGTFNVDPEEYETGMDKIFGTLYGNN